MSGGIEISDFQSLPFGSIEDPITYVSFIVTKYNGNSSIIFERDNKYYILDDTISI